MIAEPDMDSLVGVSHARQYLWDAGGPVYGRGRVPNSVELTPAIVEAMSLYMVRRAPGAPRPSSALASARSCST
jgi:hypothetical protein